VTEAVIGRLGISAISPSTALTTLSNDVTVRYEVLHEGRGER
jgi:hypothetical protein